MVSNIRILVYLVTILRMLWYRVTTKNNDIFYGYYSKDNIKSCYYFKASLVNIIRMKYYL